MGIQGSSSLDSAAVVWEKCCVIPDEGFVSCVSTEIFLAFCSKHVLQNSLGFVLFLFVSLRKRKIPKHKRKSKTDEERRH